MRQGFFKPTELAVLEQPQSVVPQCGTCRLFESCKSPKMKVWGNGERRILIVFGHPTIEADAKNHPIAGVGGTLYREQFRRAGIELSECLVTHAVICKPKKDTKSDVIGWCRPNLINTIRKHRPEVIVTVGSEATASLIEWAWGDKAESIYRWAGYQIPSTKLNAWICPLLSHQEINADIRSDPVVNQLYFDRHLSSLSRIKGKPFPNGPTDYNSRITVCTDPSDAADFLFHNVHEGGTVAFDFETNCLKPDSSKAKIYSCSMSNGKWSIAYPWHGRAIDATTRILKDRSIGKIGCNIKFEDRWVRAKLGIEVKNWKWDTMLAAHGQENATKVRHITSIKFQAFVKLGVTKWNRRVESLLKSDDEKNGNSLNRIHEIDLPTLLEYNGLDSLYEYHVAQIQMKRGSRVEAIK